MTDKIKTVNTRGDAWLQKLAEHKRPDFEKRSRIWCKYISDVASLDISQTSGYSLQADFRRVDETIAMEANTFLVIARQREKTDFHGKPHYDIKLIQCDGVTTREVPQEVMMHAVSELLSSKHIEPRQLSAAKTNKLYACALFCYRIMYPDAGKRFDPSSIPSPLSVFANRKPRRRVTRIAEIQEEIDQTDKEFQP